MEKQRHRGRITDEAVTDGEKRHGGRITDEAVTDGETET